MPTPMRSRPPESTSASAACLTDWDPGTTIIFTFEATLRPFTTSAAARRSLMRELVQLPMKICSIATSCIRWPAVSPI